MLRLTLMDGSRIEIPREDAREFIPYRAVFSNPALKSPIDGLLNHRGKLIPVLGPLPSGSALEGPLEARPFLVLMKDCAQVVRGLPEFEEAESAEVIPLHGISSLDDEDSHEAA